MSPQLLLKWTALGFVLAIALAVALPLVVGGRPMVVLSGSMTPAIRTGDVVVVHPITPSQATVGDVLTFQDPEGSGRLLVHRARAVRRRGDRVAFTTQGDANSTQEHWNVAAGGAIGKVAYRVPKLGWAAGWINSPGGRAGLVALPAILLGASLLRCIWRKRPDPRRPDEVAV
jgi:signal peptidase